MRKKIFFLLKIFEVKENNNGKKEKFSPYISLLAVRLLTSCRVVKIKGNVKLLKINLSVLPLLVGREVFG